MTPKPPTQSTPTSLADVRALLEANGQQHLLAFHDTLDEGVRTTLLEQIASVPWRELDELIDRYVRHPAEPEIPTDLEPAPYYPAESGGAYDADEAQARGAALVTAGKVAAFTVAGGQGTRLGWDGPKGTFPGTPVTGKPLFQVFAEQILAAERTYGVSIPWYIMTSPINDAATRAFIQDDNCFGLKRSNIFMFPQGVMPSIDAQTGKILLAGPGEIAMSPDGHGGSLKALRTSGAIEDMRARGIEHISYFQVDNPTVKAIDPLFLGLHAGATDSSGEMSSKIVAKAYAEEKVGVFCRSSGRTMVIEYSDLPETLANATDDDARLRYRAGSIAIHALGVDFVERLTADPDHFGLPYHRAVKKVRHVDPSSGQVIEPDEPNAVKLETFVFDAVPMATSSIVLETDRVEEFAPIKNRSGVDSAESSHRLQSERAARWLEANGVTVARDAEGQVAAEIEISPLTARGPDDLAEVELPTTVAAGAQILL